jgi:hypothetical protein
MIKRHLCMVDSNDRYRNEFKLIKAAAAPDGI